MKSKNLFPMLADVAQLCHGLNITFTMYSVHNTDPEHDFNLEFVSLKAKKLQGRGFGTVYACGGQLFGGDGFYHHGYEFIDGLAKAISEWAAKGGTEKDMHEELVLYTEDCGFLVIILEYHPKTVE